MRQVEAVLHWPPDLKVTRDKLGVARQRYDEAVASGDHEEATRMANLWQRHGTTLLDSQRKADELGRKACDDAFKRIQPAVDEALVIRSRPDCPAGEAQIAEWDLRYGELDKARSETRWQAAQDLMPAVGKAAEALRKASLEESEFKSALGAHDRRRSGAALEGASTAQMDRLRKAADAMATHRDAKAWAQAGDQVREADAALDEAIATAAAWRDYQLVQPAADDLMRQVDAVAVWPRSLQSRLEPLRRVRTAGTDAAALSEYARATDRAKAFQVDARKLLDDKRIVDEQKRTYDEAWAGVSATHQLAVEARALTPCPADDAAQREWDQAVAAHDDAKAAEQWDRARGSLARIEAAAHRLTDARAAMDAFVLADGDLAALVAQARAFEGEPTLQGSAGAWRVAVQRVTTLKDQRKWAAAQAALPALEAASRTLATLGDLEQTEAGAASYQALKSYLSTGALHGTRAEDLARWNLNNGAYPQKYNAEAYDEAKQHLLEADEAARDLLASMAAHDRYNAVATTAANQKAEDALRKAGDRKASPPTCDRFYAARSPWVAAFNEQRWADATACFRTLLEASTLVLEDAAFQDAYDKPTRDAVAAAEKSSAYPPPPGTTAATKFGAFWQAKERLDASVKESKFTQARNGLPALKAAADQLVNALNSTVPGADAGRFDQAWALTAPKLRAAKETKARVGVSMPALEATWRDLLAAEDTMDKAKAASQWVKARAALAALDKALDRFEAKHLEGAAFETQYTPAIRKSAADALAVVAEGLPHLAADGKAFADLHRVVMSLIAAGRYTEAGAQLAELERQAKALVERDAQMGAKDAPDRQRIRQLMLDAKALKDRVAEPARDLASTAVAAVSVPADACIQHLASATPDAAQAQVELDKAKAQFTAAERAREVAWTRFHEDARRQIAEARAAGEGLDAGLKALRNKAIEAGQAAIAKAVSKKHFGSATAKTRQLLDEAAVWMDAKPAFDRMNKNAQYLPQLATLKNLASRSGGAKVIDALIAEGMRPGQEIGADVINIALEARFGFKAQRFERRNTTGGAASEEDNVAPKAVTFEDKSIAQTYQVMAKVPQQQWTAKVAAMVVYDKNQDDKVLGGHFSRKGDERKIYMYCGRPEDANKQTFGKDQKVLPEGEKVEPDCEPADESAAPLFDFTLLHEAGHAEDDARGYMDAHGSQADHGGWKKHAGPQEFAGAVATHFGYDEAYVLATLQSPNSVPPRLPADMPTGGDAAKWEQARQDAVAWCRSVREGAQPWEDPGLSRSVAIQGRVYQESAAGKWVSYDLAARARGISSYQFRSPAEWFAELYAAYFSKKLKPSHPSAKWLKTFKSAAARA